MTPEDLDLVEGIVKNCGKLRENLEKEIEEIEGRQMQFSWDEGFLKNAKRTLELVERVLNYFSC